MSDAYEKIVVCHGNIQLSCSRQQHHYVAYGCVKGTAAKSFVAACDLEKAAHHGASSTGESLATRGTLSVNLLKVGSAAASPSRAYINCLYDAVAELKDSGCFVYS